MRARTLLAAAAVGVVAVGCGVGGVLLMGAGRSADDQQGFLAGLVSHALSSTSTQVHVGAVDGALSSDATVHDIVISDRDGPWLRLDHARIRWRRAALLRRRLEIDELDIGHLEIARRPLLSDRPRKDDKPLLPDLPVKVDIRQFALANLDLGPTVIGVAMRAAATGDTALGSPSEGLAFHLDGRRLDSPGRFFAAIGYVPKSQALGVKVKLDEPAGGLVSKLAHLPDEPPVKLDLSGDGTIDSFAGTIDFTAGPRIDAKGTVTLHRDGRARLLATRVAGHLGPMLPTPAAAIFEGETDLASDLRFGDDGAITLETADLVSHLARFAAHGTFGADKLVDFTSSVRAVPNNGGLSAVGASSIRTLRFDARVAGPVKAPRVAMTLAVADARLPEGSLGRLDASFSAVPSGEVTDLATRIALDGKVDADGIAPRDAALARALGGTAALRLRGATDTRGHAVFDEISARTPTASLAFVGNVARDSVRGHVAAGLPDLARFGALVGKPLAGRIDLGADLDDHPEAGTGDLTLAGRAEGVATGIPAVDGLAGRTITLSGHLARSGENLHVDRLALAAMHAAATIRGSIAPQANDIVATLDLPDVGRGDPRLTGRAHAEAHLTGSLDHPTLAATAALDAASAIGRPIPHLAVTATVADARRRPIVSATLDGTIDRKPARARIDASGVPADATWTLGKIDAAIGSTRLTGTGTLRRRVLAGDLHLDAPDLDDLSALALTKLAGAVRFDVAFTDPAGRQDAEATLNARDLRAAGASLRDVVLSAHVRDAWTHPVVDGDIRIGQGQIAGQPISAVRLSAQGATDASRIDVSARGPGFDLAATGSLLPPPASRFDLQRFAARRGARHIDLAGPATFALADGGLDIRHLALAIMSGRLAIDGRVGKSLDLRLAAKAVPLAAADIAAPGLGLGGTLDASAALAGPVTAPTGDYKITLRKVTAAQAHGFGVPPVDVTAGGRLAGGRATLDAKVAAGRAGTLTIAGSLPLDPTGAFDLGTKGRLDAAVANTVLGPGGRTVSGALIVDGRLSGTKAAPKLSGSATMAGGTFRDTLVGVRLDDIGLKIAAQGDRVAIERLAAKTPGGGTIEGSGNVRIDPGAGFPGAVTIHGHHATLAESSLLTATADLAMDVSGALARDPRVHGKIDITHVDVGIPDRLPATLRPIDGITHVNAPQNAAARLALIAKKTKPTFGTKGRAALFDAGLDVTVAAPSRIFVRGRGMDAELGGDLHVTGTTNHPAINGGFGLRTGKLVALGKTMTFTKGNLTFTGDLVPEVDFAAEISANDLVAQIAVTGPAAAPTFAFTSQPALPQDEILSRVLFNKPSGNLSGFQALQLAQAAAQFSSGDDGAFEKLRRSLGVDSLDVGSGTSGGPAVGVSRAISDRVSVGVHTGATTEDTGLSADVDVTRHVRVQSNVNSNGSTSLGVGSEIEY